MTDDAPYRIRANERLPLGLVVAGLGLYVAGFALMASLGPLAPATVFVGALGWFLVPLGVYRDAEALDAEHVLWNPGFVNIAAASVPFVGVLGGIVFLMRRLRLARSEARTFQ
jgi:hypothetical protein